MWYSVPTMNHLSASQLHRIACLSLAQRATLARLLDIQVTFPCAYAIARNA